jgi:hypothetical protein
MSRIEDRLRTLGLTLPPPLAPPPGVVLPFRFVHVVGRRALISGHGPQNPDGTLVTTGKVGREVSLEQAYGAAKLTGLAILGSLKRALGDLDRVAAWGRVLGDGEFRARFQPAAARHQRLFGPDSRALRAGGRRAFA